MDAAGIKRGVVRLDACSFGNSFHPAVANEYEQVRAENAWTAAQASPYPDRLIAFCGVSPLKEYVLREIDRCAQQRGLSKGLNLHSGNSDIEMENRLTSSRCHACLPRRIGTGWRSPLPFARTPTMADRGESGRLDHEGVDKTMEVFVSAIAAKDPRMQNVYFDVSVAGWEGKKETFQCQLRAVSMDRLAATVSPGYARMLSTNSFLARWTIGRSTPRGQTDARPERTLRNPPQASRQARFATNFQPLS